MKTASYALELVGTLDAGLMHKWRKHICQKLTDIGDGPPCKRCVIKNIAEKRNVENTCGYDKKTLENLLIIESRKEKLEKLLEK